MPWIGCCFLFIVAILTLLFSGVVGNHAKDFSNILASAKIWVFDDAVSNMIDVVSNMIDVVSSMIDVISNMVDVVSKIVDVVSNMVDVVSIMIDVVSNMVDVGLT